MSDMKPIKSNLAYKGTSKNPCLSFEAIFFSDTSLAKYSFSAVLNSVFAASSQKKMAASNS